MHVTFVSECMLVGVPIRRDHPDLVMPEYIIRAQANRKRWLPQLRKCRTLHVHVMMELHEACASFFASASSSSLPGAQSSPAGAIALVGSTLTKVHTKVLHAELLVQKAVGTANHTCSMAVVTANHSYCMPPLNYNRD